MLRDLELSDIPKLEAFAPKEWNMALDALFLKHFGRSYFHSRVWAEPDGILAVGQGIVNGATGWIGNIIVRPEARKRGLGSRMTQDVIDLLRARGCSTLLLIATELGEPVYHKLGFRKTGEYVFLQLPRLLWTSTTSVRRLKQSEADAVFKLDAFASGEARSALLAPDVDAGWAHVDPDGALDGFFLPTFGAGLIIAIRPSAGLALQAFKHTFYPGAAVVPTGNDAALHFLVEHGAIETARAPRMAFGPEVSWKEEYIFARGAGYCG